MKRLLLMGIWCTVLPYVALGNIVEENTSHKIAELSIQQGDLYLKARDYDNAISSYSKGIINDELPIDTQFNLGVAHIHKNQIHEAIESFRKVILKNPAHPKALTELGKIGHKQQQFDAAVQFYLNALLADPAEVEAQLGLARVYYEQAQYPLAVETYKKAMEKDPSNPIHLFEFANALNMSNHTEQSLAIYKALDDRFGGNPSILYNIAYTLKKLGRVEDAIPYYEKLLKIEPTHAEGIFSLGCAYLLKGLWEEGWKNYEGRWNRTTQAMKKRVYDKPAWDGSLLHGETVFLYAEQGLGDTYQFIRYAREVTKRGGKVVVAVQNPLVTILSLCPYIEKVISLGEEPPHFDYYVPLMSLPYILNTRVNTVPNEMPYLFAKPELVEEWREKLSHDKNFKIGICWQGNSNYSTPLLRAVVAAKSMTVDTFAPIFQIPGVSVYCLQKETGMDQLNKVPAGCTLHTFDETFDSTNGRFMDTAAVMKNLDLVITVDTGTAHLAAGLGVPTWVFIPNPPDWRWMLDRNDTPWYPTMRLFRQETVGDWSSVMATIADALREHIAHRDTAPTTHTVSAHEAVTATRADEATALPCKSLQETLRIIESKLDVNVQKMVTTYESDNRQCTENVVNHVRACYLLSNLRNELRDECSLINTING